MLNMMPDSELSLEVRRLSRLSRLHREISEEVESELRFVKRTAQQISAQLEKLEGELREVLQGEGGKVAASAILDRCRPLLQKLRSF